jgi:uncharacterized protein (TIGR02391 family)
MAVLPSINECSLEAICNALADAATHKELSRLLSQCGIDECGGTPKWERMLMALSSRQQRDRCGNNVIGFICAILHPSRFEGRHQEFEDFRASVNYQLSFIGLAINEKAQPQNVTTATTISEARERASELRSELERRSVHPDVLRFCKAELLQDNYFHCVLEATKSAAQKLRDRTGLESDGGSLVDQALSIKTPRLALNTLQTESEQSEQKGFANLLKGVFGTFRNVTAHAPKIHWSVNRTDAMDALTIISYIHRRLDEAVVVPPTSSPF